MGTFVMFDSVVPSQMNSKVTRLGKRGLTFSERAFVGLRFGKDKNMCLGMSNQISSTDESHRTMETLELFITSVTLKMNTQMAWLSKGRITFAALKRPVVGMDSPMGGQFVICSEPIPTIFALVRCVAGMHEKMNLKFSIGCKSIFAIKTGEWLSVLVQPNVSLKKRNIGKYQLAMGTFF